MSVVTEAAAAPLLFFLRAFCAVVAEFLVGGARVAVFVFSAAFFLGLLISGFGFSTAGRMVPYLKYLSPPH